MSCLYVTGKRLTFQGIYGPATRIEVVTDLQYLSSELNFSFWRFRDLNADVKSKGCLRNLICDALENAATSDFHRTVEVDSLSVEWLLLYESDRRQK